MKKSSRKFFLFVISKLIPEIHYLRWIYNGSSEDSHIDKEAKIYPPFHLQNSSLGKATYIAENAVVKNTTIGKYCSIGPNLLCGWGIHPTNGISTSPSFYSTKNQNHITYSKYDKIEETQPIIIGNDVFIGMNVTILDGIKIGDGAVIGAGAVVSKDIPPYAIAVGSPIRIIKYRFKTEQIQSLLRIQWWNFDDEELKDVEGMFFDIDGFLKKYSHG